MIKPIYAKLPQLTLVARVCAQIIAGAIALLFFTLGCNSGGSGSNYGVEPVITQQPASATIAPGGDVTFSVAATGGTLTYQWFDGTNEVAGATSATYSISNATTNDAGTYYVVVSNAYGFNTSSGATLTVGSGGNAPIITTQPASTTVSTGDSGSFTVVATGGTLSYQWYYNGTAISGATSATYSISSVASGNAGTYYVVVTNTFGSTTSSSATLTVSSGMPPDTAPVITTQPSSTEVTAGTPAVFTVAASGGTLSYQWYYNSAPISGATEATYTDNDVTTASAGSYYVIVTNSYGSTTSNSATLKVDAATPPATDPGYRVQVYVDSNSGNVNLPAATQAWTIQYEFTVPPLPTSSTWNFTTGTVYQWGDVDFDTYSSGGTYPVQSSYVYNQIVPQLILGNVLSGNDANYNASGSQINTWAIEAQYYWQKGSSPMAQNGSIVSVNPGDEITTTIAYSPTTGAIVASIADNNILGPSGTSTITIARPFPDDPSLFTSWTDFFNKAETASGQQTITSHPVLNVETDNIDEPTMCALLPFTIEAISIPGAPTTPAGFATQPVGGLTCTQSLSSLTF